MTVHTDFPRPDPALIRALAAHSVASLHEAADKRGALDSGVRPLATGTRLAGPALTVSQAATDNLLLHLALSIARPGDVLVVDSQAMTEAGAWGDLMTASAIARGLGGLVIDGSVRDTGAIRAMGFPVFSRGICVKGTTKVRVAGDVGTTVPVGGIAVSAGDIVIGDDDGVMVIRRGEAETILERVVARDAWEGEIRRRLEAGESTIDVLGLGGPLREVGISWKAPSVQT